MADGLSEKIDRKTARVAILGLGYVGLPLGIEFARRGFKVTGFDVNPSLASSLNRGVSHITDVSSASLKELIQTGCFRATHRFDALAKQDAVIICVPTPLRKSREPDVSYILSAARQIAQHLRKGQLVILESTTYPGTTRELVLPLFQKTGLKLGKDFHLAFSPERVDPGNKIYHIANTPKVVGGLTPASGELACRLYSRIVQKVVPVSCAESAEMVKLLENTFRAVNIGLVNEVALMCDRLGLNVWEIIAAAASKPFGYMPFYPGPGIGGHCIPLDPHYLAWKMKSLNFEPRFIELAGVINSSMPEYAVRRIGALLNERRKALKGSRILILGVAYKPNVSDVRESPALDVIHLLQNQRATVLYHDPFVPAITEGLFSLKSRPLTATTVHSADMVVILTAHSRVDYRWVLRRAKLVFDARNALAGVSDSKLFRL